MLRTIDTYGIIARASNLHRDENPSYTVEDFLSMYPKFKDVPRVMLEAWLNIAHSCVSERRWHSYWLVGMGLFMAHHLTLACASETSERIEDGLAKGLIGSKSVSDMSISYDFGSIASEFAGWGTYSQTRYGQQLVQMARIVGRGGMTVW